MNNEDTNNNDNFSAEEEYQEIIGLLVHSYNNYLSGLLGFTELALMECEQEKVKERLDLAMVSGKDAVTFGRQLLSSIGRLQVKFNQIDLRKLIVEITASSEGVTFSEKEQHRDDRDWMINTDKNWFRYCLMSLIEFSQHYSKENKMEIQLINSSQSISVQLSSRFQLNDEQQLKLFNPFYSSRVLLGKKDIGLAMLKGFILQMGGNIKWNTQQGFVINIPKAE